jgi:putative spermidine/putrescine transport system ATP-binding protein
MRGTPDAEVRREVKRVLELIQLADVGGRLPRALSGGQQQRIALARCIVYRPSIILMDEPLGALDKKLRDQMKLEIKRLHEELGITVVYVTHDQEEAMIMSDRICLMNNARIEQIGTPSDLYFKPKTTFAADFLGESNLLDASVGGIDGGDINLVTAAGTRLKAAQDPERSFQKGQAVKVMVRPEMISVLNNGAAAENVIEGRVTDSILVGGVTKYYARLADGTEVSATDLTRGPMAPLARDSVIRFGWPKESAVLLPLGEDAA